MKTVNTFLVTYVKEGRSGINDVVDYTDHYEVFEYLPDAHKRYEAICDEDDTWSANVSRVIRSTDYNLPVHKWNLDTRVHRTKLFKERGIKSPNQK